MASYSNSEGTWYFKSTEDLEKWANEGTKTWTSFEAEIAREEQENAELEDYYFNN